VVEMFGGVVEPAPGTCGLGDGTVPVPPKPGPVLGGAVVPVRWQALSQLGQGSSGTDGTEPANPALNTIAEAPRPAATAAAAPTRFMDISCAPSRASARTMTGGRAPIFLRAGHVQYEWLAYRLRLLRIAHVGTGRGALDLVRLPVYRGSGVAALTLCGVGVAERDAVDAAQSDRMDDGRVVGADHGTDAGGRVADTDIDVGAYGVAGE